MHVRSYKAVCTAICSTRAVHVHVGRGPRSHARRSSVGLREYSLSRMVDLPRLTLTRNWGMLDLSADSYEWSTAAATAGSSSSATSGQPASSTKARAPPRRGQYPHGKAGRQRFRDDRNQWYFDRTWMRDLHASPPSCKLLLCTIPRSGTRSSHKQTAHIPCASCSDGGWTI